MSTPLTEWSVVIPCHNAAKTLRRCLESVFAQTAPPGEVIVVDDAGTDGSAAIAAEFGCRVVEQRPNRGPAAARNLGAATAAGEVLFFLDSDLALEPDALERAADALEADADTGVVQGVYAPEPLVDDGPVERYKVLFEHHWRVRAAGTGSATLFALTAIRAKAFADTGGFDESLRDGEDVELGTRLPPRWTVRTDPAVRGRHDDVDTLGGLLAEQWQRSLRFAELLIRSRRSAEGGQSVRTVSLGPVTVLSCALVVAGLPLAMWWPPLAVVPPAAAAVFGVANTGLLRGAAVRGPGWVAAVFGLHLLYVATAGLAALVGVLRPAVWTVRP
ncbi:glycosyltransferase family 2 protein [Glycomyces xiaoerkulensis]|uniref:glycosyltransferase family 2 protein n=1 Tax=Glycomyces xiaoerkulensis TaxID=2038139 RepID=UPI000C26A606|nr:glycosyltransferase family 2 protein [Glycomyces xiaoerkulensis]